MSESTIHQRLQCSEDHMLYTYAGRSPFDGLLMYEWSAEDGSPQTYEVTETEVNELITLGWWSPIAADAGGARP